MKRRILIIAAIASLATAGAITAAFASSATDGDARKGNAAAGMGQGVIPLKEAKLNIEHNATDADTGFQGFIDSEGWQTIEISGPGGTVATFEARGDMRELGLTELFFESVEPANEDVPIEDLLDTLPPGNYTIAGRAIEDGQPIGRTLGTALLTHDIPTGPALLAPEEESTVGTNNVVMSWSPVTQTIDGSPVTIVAYQLIVEKDAEPHPHMIGTFGLSMYLPPSTTSIRLPDGFLEPGTAYGWEVLAIEESGNQTLSSGSFETR